MAKIENNKHNTTANKTDPNNGFKYVNSEKVIKEHIGPTQINTGSWSHMKGKRDVLREVLNNYSLQFFTNEKNWFYSHIVDR